MSDTVQIPEDVKKKINVAASKIYSSTSFVERIGFRTGAEFGYSLSQQQLAEKDKEIDLLLAIIENQHKLMVNGEQRGINKAKEEFQQQIQSFREKLKNITVDELLKNPGAIKLFDEEFKN